jgi:hypothetical protein
MRQVGAAMSLRRQTGYGFSVTDRSPSESTTDEVEAGPTHIERFGYTQELKRSLSTADLVICGLIFIVPIAPFAIFGSVFSLSGGMVALAYCIGLVAMKWI